MNATASTPFFCRYCVGSCHSLHVGRRCNEQRYEEPHEQCTCTVTVPTPSPTDQQTGAVTDQQREKAFETQMYEIHRDQQMPEWGHTKWCCFNAGYEAATKGTR